MRMFIFLYTTTGTATGKPLQRLFRAINTSAWANRNTSRAKTPVAIRSGQRKRYIGSAGHANCVDSGLTVAWGWFLSGDQVLAVARDNGAWWINDAFVIIFRKFRFFGCLFLVITHTRSAMLRDPDKIIASAKAKYMSDAKWRKLIATIENSKLQITESHWQWLGEERIFRQSGFPKISDTNEHGIVDGRWFPNYFRHIYCITIPRLCPDPRDDPKRLLPTLSQPIEELAMALSAAADFPISVTEHGLVIQAYAL